MKPVLAVDFDDVLFPFMNRFVPHYNEMFQTNFVLDDYYTFEFNEIWGGTHEAAWQRVATFFGQPHDQIEPVDGAQEAIDALSVHYELAVVTARDETLRANTENWLAQMFPDRFDHVFLCNSYSLNPAIKRRSKLEVVEALDAIGLIDDSLPNVSLVSAAGRSGMLFGDFAWNRSDLLPEGVNRFAGWQSIVESLVVAE